MKGMRKFWLGFAFVLCCTAVDLVAILSSQSPLSAAELGGLAGLHTGWATGLGVVIWGNIREHQAQNGKP